MIFPNVPDDPFEADLIEFIRDHRETLDKAAGGEADDGALAFVALVRLTNLYVRMWTADSPAGSLAQFVVDADDAEDPNRVLDPQAALTSTLIELTLDALGDNVAAALGVE